MGKTPEVVCGVAREVTIEGDLTHSAPVGLDDLDVADVEELLRFLEAARRERSPSLNVGEVVVVKDKRNRRSAKVDFAEIHPV